MTRRTALIAIGLLIVFVVSLVPVGNQSDASFLQFFREEVAHPLSDFATFLVVIMPVLSLIFMGLLLIVWLRETKPGQLRLLVFASAVTTLLFAITFFVLNSKLQQYLSWSIYSIPLLLLLFWNVAGRELKEDSGVTSTLKTPIKQWSVGNWSSAGLVVVSLLFLAKGCNWVGGKVDKAEHAIGEATGYSEWKQGQDAKTDELLKDVGYTSFKDRVSSEWMELPAWLRNMILVAVCLVALQIAGFNWFGLLRNWWGNR